MDSSTSFVPHSAQNDRTATYSCCSAFALGQDSTFALITCPLLPVMNVFELRDCTLADYAAYVRSFVQIRHPRIRAMAEHELEAGALWPQPLLQLNPAFERGRSVDQLCVQGILHPTCAAIFRRKSHAGSEPLHLHQHQEEAIEIARTGAPYVLTTGTGSGKSLTYIIPIVDSILRRGSGKGVQAVIVYPMNALANSQMGELEKFLCEGFAPGQSPVTFARYTGQDNLTRRQEILDNPPDIILTNFVMLELMLTRQRESALLRAMQGARGRDGEPIESGLRWLVLDELHTYRGRQGSDVAVLVRRAREMTSGPQLQCVGTSATIVGGGTRQQGRQQVARVASQLFGVRVRPEHIIGETLRRVTQRRDLSRESERALLRARLQEAEPAAQSFDQMRLDPLAAWVEETFGLTEVREDGETFWKRSAPQALGGEEGAARALSDLTGVVVSACEARVREFLLGAYQSAPDPLTGKPPFAFRLHQWISRGDTVYASLQPDLENRYFTMSGQAFVPESGMGQRRRALFPLAFCRECGHEFYTVWKVEGEGELRFAPRALLDTSGESAPVLEAKPGFLYVSEESAANWSSDAEQITDRVPEEWIEEHRGAPRIKASQRDNVPRPLWLDALGARRIRGRGPGCGRVAVLLDGFVAAVLPVLRRDLQSQPTLGFRQAIVAGQRRPLDRDDDSVALAFDGIAGRQGARTGRTQAAFLYRQPPGRLAASRTLQRFCRDFAFTRRALPRDARCGAARLGTRPTRAARLRGARLAFERIRARSARPFRRADRGPTGATRRDRLPFVSRFAARLARDFAQLRAVRFAGNRLRFVGRIGRGGRYLERAASRVISRHAERAPRTVAPVVRCFAPRVGDLRYSFRPVAPGSDLQPRDAASQGATGAVEF